MSNKSPFNTNRLSVLLSKRLGTETSVCFSRELSQGKSGAGVCLVEVHDPSGIEFAVVKIAGDGKNDDLHREAEAMRQVRELWPRDVLPQRCTFFSEPDPDLVPDRSDAAVLVTSFVHPKDADVATFKELLGMDMGRCKKALTELLNFYRSVLKGRRETAVEPRPARDHFTRTLGTNLCEKLRDCGWLRLAGIDPGRCMLLVGDTVCPNAAYAFNDEGCWDDMMFSAPCIPLHGDLNADNLMLLPDGRLMFIDFEKFRHGMAYWDIAFLMMWVAQVVLLDDRDAPLGTVLGLAQGYAASHGKESEAGTAFGSIVEPFATLARQFLYPLGGPQDPMASERFTADSFRKAAALSVAGAALARAYYQFSGSKRGS